MNRKTILICITAVVILFAAVAVAVFFLYSGTDQDSHAYDLNDSVYGCYQAIPSDAVAVMHFDRFGTFLESFAGESPTLDIIENDGFRKFMDAAAGAGYLKSAEMTLSCHYVGGLEILAVLDAGRSGAEIPEAVDSLLNMAEKAGLYSAVSDGRSLAMEGTYISRRKLLSVSTSDVLLGSSERHIMEGISVLDNEGFCQAAEAVQGSAGQVLVSNASIGRLLEKLFTAEYRRHSDFLRRFAEWTAFSADVMTREHLVMTGSVAAGTGPDRFVNIFRNTAGAASHVADMVPSYTVSLFTVPVKDVSAHVSAYRDYADTRIGQARYDAVMDGLSEKTGISPDEWARQIGIREVAVASFYVGDSLESVLLINAGNISAAGLTDSGGTAADFPYRGYAAALFGSLFSVPDESRYICRDGWIIAGSGSAISEYTGGRALDRSLASYMEGAGCQDIGRGEPHFIGYFSFTEDRRAVDRVFGREYAEALASSYADAAYAPAVFRIVSEKGALRLTFSVDRIMEMKSEAPAFERDTVVVVPDGPFKVRNSATGKMNTFYQNDNMYLCLNDENGRGMWGVKFSEPLCGRAATIDYFRNGKLQILFAAGSELYLLDRLGRRVEPFPVDLGKKILLGPDVYDFNGRRIYNVLVLHDDNTVEMYNLQGKKPAAWKGITADETIRNLPEPVKVDGSTWWVVRTSIQTLIYPFYGGDPVAVSEGDRMIRPDSEVVPVKGGVRVTRYDGRTVTIQVGNDN